MIACRNAAGQFLLFVVIFKDVNRKHDFCDGLSPESDVYMKRKSSHIRSNLFIKWFTEHFFKHRTSGKVILFVDGRSFYNFRLLLKITLLLVVYRISILTLYNFWISIIWAFKEPF